MSITSSMAVSDVLKEFAPFVNQYGMVPYSTGPIPTVTQNDTLFTCYYMMALENSLGGIPVLEAQRLSKAYDAHILEDGLTLRTPSSHELESHDNLTAWGLVSMYLYKDYAARILSYARKNAWIWPGDDHIGRAYLGRHKVLEPHLMVCAGESPDFLLQAVWCGVILTSLTAKGDGYSLCALLVKAVEKGYRVPLSMRIAASIWVATQKARKLTLGENLAQYYGWEGSPHAKYL